MELLGGFEPPTSSLPIPTHLFSHAASCSVLFIPLIAAQALGRFSTVACHILSPPEVHAFFSTVWVSCGFFIK